MSYHYRKLYKDPDSEWFDISRAAMLKILTATHNNARAALAELEDLASRGKVAEIQTCFAYYAVVKDLDQ